MGRSGCWCRSLLEATQHQGLKTQHYYSGPWGRNGTRQRGSQTASYNRIIKMSNHVDIRPGWFMVWMALDTTSSGLLDHGDETEGCRSASGTDWWTCTLHGVCADRCTYMQDGPADFGWFNLHFKVYRVFLLDQFSKSGEELKYKGPYSWPWTFQLSKYLCQRNPDCVSQCSWNQRQFSCHCNDQTLPVMHWATRAWVRTRSCWRTAVTASFEWQ